MTVNHTIVPLLDRAELREWNLANERARRAYLEDPFAFTRLEAATCTRCRERKHHRCSSQAWRFSRIGVCACFVDDHPGATQRV